MSAPAVLVNGAPGGAASALDRGLTYGDGLFETIAARDGLLEFWDRHERRLLSGLARLGIPAPDPELLRVEALGLLNGRSPAVIKIVVTRGEGGRGYAPPGSATPTRIISRHPFPEWPAAWAEHGVKVRWCETRLSRNPALAGIKHLNRLEQVLARREWDDPGIAEGLMLDTGDRVVEATARNLFLVRDGALLTPSLMNCGVAGVMRAVIMERAERLGISVSETALCKDDVESADEVFLTNSLCGVWPVRRIGGVVLEPGPVTRRLIMEDDD